MRVERRESRQMAVEDVGVLVCETNMGEQMGVADRGCCVMGAYW